MEREVKLSVYPQVEGNAVTSTTGGHEIPLQCVGGYHVISS